MCVMVWLSLKLLLLLIATTSSWPAREAERSVDEPTCSNRLDGEACHCDTSCAQYGDCCLDAPSFVPEQQQLGASLFTCENLDNISVYMMSSCPPEWEDPYTRFLCEHPDNSYRDPLFDLPVTSHRTNVTYRNRHCASCHRDLDAGTIDMWSFYFSCENAWVNFDDDVFINHLMYNTATSSWILNITENPELLIFQDLDNSDPSRLLYNCRVGVLAPETLHPILRTCSSSIVNTCSEDWTDEGVRAQCQAYTAHMCLNGTVYRNHYCGVCNNNGSFHGFHCLEFSWRLWPPTLPPDFSVLLDWRSLRKRDICQEETEAYDPFTRTCRPAFVEAEDMEPENYTASVNETSISSLDTCLKILLKPDEYYIEDNDTMTVFVPAYNMTLQLHEYRIGNNSQLIICLPKFNVEDIKEFAQGLRYITIAGVSLSIFFLMLHLLVFCMSPKLCNLSSMNLASLSVALLLMYCAFFVGFRLRNTGVACVVMAVIIHYSLLASFCWMLTIAYDINRTLRQATTKLLILTGKHWQRFGLYSLWSWVVPAVIVGAALAAEFSTSEVLQYLRPGYGANECWFSGANGLLVFTVTPLLVVMVLNSVFFFWSAYLIHSTTSELRNMSSIHRDFRLYARLAVIMGLTWIIGLVAGYVDVLVVWYAFVLLNTLQGLFIFLAFTCTQKVWHGLCEEQGLQCWKQIRGAKSVFVPGTATTYT